MGINGLDTPLRTGSTDRSTVEPSSGAPLAGRGRGPVNGSISVSVNPLTVLGHPIAVIALAVWVLNDHVLKAAFGTWWTGKLSDVAGLVVFPLLVATVARKVTDRPIEWAIAGTGVFFTAINTWAPATASVEWALSLVLRSTLTPDVTDLLTLPALGGAWWLWQRPTVVVDRSKLRRTVGRAAFAVGVAASVATSSDGTTSQRYEGVTILTEDQQSVEIPVTLTKDDEPLDPAEPMEATLAVTVFGSADGNRTPEELSETVVVDTENGAVDGEGTVTIRLTDPSLAPIEVRYEMWAWIGDGDGDTTLDLQAELPPNESFDPIASRPAVDGEESLLSEWRITASAESELLIGVPSGIEPLDVRMATTTQLIEHPGGQAIPLATPDDCGASCEFSLWVAVTPYVWYDEVQQIALYDVAGEASVDIVDLERQVVDFEVRTEDVRVDSETVLQWDVDVDLPALEASPPVIATTFLTALADGPEFGDGDLWAGYRVEGFDPQRFRLGDDCCADLTLRVDVYAEGDPEPDDVSATLQLQYHSISPVPAEQLTATLRQR